MDVIGGLRKRKKSRPVSSLHVEWEQYASETDAGAAAVENGSGAYVIEELFFNRSAEGLMRQNQGTKFTRTKTIQYKSVRILNFNEE